MLLQYFRNDSDRLPGLRNQTSDESWFLACSGCTEQSNLSHSGLFQGVWDGVGLCHLALLSESKLSRVHPILQDGAHKWLGSCIPELGKVALGFYSSQNHPAIIASASNFSSTLYDPQLFKGWTNIAALALCTEYKKWMLCWEISSTFAVTRTILFLPFWIKYCWACNKPQ